MSIANEYSDSVKDVETAWYEEIKRRLAEIDSGSVELIPWEEVRAELFSLSVSAESAQVKDSD